MSYEDKNDLILIDPALPHGGGVRLGTLIFIRWLAITGQVVALTIVHYYLAFEVRLDLTLPTILISALLNLWFSLRADKNTRLTDSQSAAHLMFDLMHLAALLFFTGGLSNPFAVLMLAPSSVSATILGRKSTKYLTVAAIGLITGLAFTPYSLPWKGSPPEINATILLGVWISLCFTLIFLAVYMSRIGREGRERARALSATRVALAHEQTMAELGTLAAAAAHELGTPLGTILLVSKELLEDCGENDERKSDLELIVQETSRCRGILAEISAKKRAGNIEHFTHVDIEALIREAAAPYESRGPVITYDRTGPHSLNINRTPEIIHALRNIIENATGFANKTVAIRINFDEEMLSVLVEDDGEGFDPQILKRLGEPYVTTRQPTPGQDGGQGLGLFIAKTLLERTGVKVSFENSSLNGACVNLAWPKNALVSVKTRSENPENEVAQS